MVKYGQFLVVALLIGCTGLEYDGANKCPEVTITAPSEEDLTNPILFEAEATDPEDGDLSEDIVWESEVDGLFGTGQSVEATLSAGEHTITAKVADLEGLTCEATLLIQVN